MKLKRFTYHEFDSQPNRWLVPAFDVPDRCLLVGKNATGKSRLLNSMFGLSSLLNGHLLVSNLVSSNYAVALEHDVSSDGSRGVTEYEFAIESNKVVKEILRVNGTERLVRESSGVCRLFMEEVSRNVEFEVAKEELAARAKRDPRQHPFLEPLLTWASLARIYRFNQVSLEQQGRMTVLGAQAPEGFDITSDSPPAAAAFSRGLRRFGAKFTDAVKQDMAGLGYPIEDISLTSIGMAPDGRPIEVVRVTESDRHWFVDQMFISSGMFTALWLLLNLELAVFSKAKIHVLIDDIGEGLDFDRSSALIKRVLEIAEENDLQLIATTNDRFVMNAVPLDYLNILQRDASIVSVINRANSREIFESFEKHGLSNFDLLARQMYRR